MAAASARRLFLRLVMSCVTTGASGSTAAGTALATTTGSTGALPTASGPDAGERGAGAGVAAATRGDTAGAEDGHVPRYPYTAAPASTSKRTAHHQRTARRGAGINTLAVPSMAAGPACRGWPGAASLRRASRSRSILLITLTRFPLLVVCPGGHADPAGDATSATSVPSSSVHPVCRPRPA